MEQKILNEKLTDIEGQLLTLEDDMLPDARESLEYLTSPDYDPKDNADHEFRDQDIESLQAEIVELESDVNSLIDKKTFLGLIPILPMEDEEVVEIETAIQRLERRGEGRLISPERDKRQREFLDRVRFEFKSKLN